MNQPNENYSEWKRGLDRKQAVRNLFYASLFALAGLGIIGGLVWLLLRIGGRV